MWKYDINNIPEEFKGPVKNRCELLNFIDREPKELWTKVKNIITEKTEKTIPKLKKEKKASMDVNQNPQNSTR